MIKVIYFNQWFSSIGPVIRDIKKLAKEEGLVIKIIGSSKNEDHAFKKDVDEFVLETWDKGSNDKEMSKNYIDWVSNLCKEKGVDVFFAKKYSDIVDENRRVFEDKGIKVIAGAKVNGVSTKRETYETLESSDRELLKKLVPSYFNPEFGSDSRMKLDEWVNGKFFNNSRVIMKLNKDEGGTSYKEIIRDKIKLSDICGYFGQKIHLSDFQRLITEQNMQDFIFMEYLSDPEISVDCYVKPGQDNLYYGDLIAIAREKVNGRVQRVFLTSDIYNIADELVSELKIEGLFNFQLRRDKNGDLKLLEINPRISGGAYIECELGINLMYFALIDALELKEGSQYVNKFLDKWESDLDIMIGKPINPGTGILEFGRVAKLENAVVL